MIGSIFLVGMTGFSYNRERGSVINREDMIKLKAAAMKEFGVPVEKWCEWYIMWHIPNSEVEEQLKKWRYDHYFVKEEK